jgi:putative Holliday junction resolvase
MGRILGIDYGERRVGLAVSDPLGTIAMPRSVLTVRDAADALRQVVAACREADAERLVVGLPLNMDGSRGAAVERVEQFVGQLRAALAIPVETWDERLSTSHAERALLEADLSRQRRRQVIDKVAAQVILQGYLDSRAPPAEEPGEA